jgi:hypothetical protein
LDQKLFVFWCTGVLICFDQPPVNFDYSKEGRMPRKISIVGNASFGCREAAIIDDCDFVVRFNDCWSVGKGGCRTDVVAATIPAGRQLSMARERSWHEKSAVASASEIWCVRDAMKFMELKTKLDPALDDFCDDYTGELAMFAAETEKVFKVIPRSHHDRIDIDLQSMSSESYVVPSSGLMAIAYVLEEVFGPWRDCRTNRGYHGMVVPSYAKNPPVWWGVKSSSIRKMRLAASSGSERW